jgi:PTH1 family peptidyl-tRNA hydrolase
MGLFGGGSGADWLIAGLGNPEPKYDGTRHNTGFAALDALAEAWGCEINKSKWQGLYGIAQVDGRKVMLLKPLTYMNLSGESVRALVDYYKIDPEEELIVIYDDISLDVGKLRIRAKGSAGGHNGIKNIIAHVGGPVFPRIKVGVGEKPPKYDLADYVLGHFSKAEQELMEEGYEDAVKAVEMIVSGDISGAMNEYNRKKKEE